MITHVVLIQPKADTTPAEMEAILVQAKALQDIIPELQDFQIGKNLATYTQGYSYGLIAHFANETQLQAYANHPAHQELVRELLAHAQVIEFNLAQ
jgi:Stress responsive A/B Barrel Domain.